MSIEVETVTTYRAVCNCCGCAGPRERTKDAAIEAVTGRAASVRIGISFMSRWLPIEGPGADGFYCGACKLPGHVPCVHGRADKGGGRDG